MFRDFPVSSNAVFLDAAIEWFNRGRSSANRYVSFLCYYLAFELLALAIADGDADFGYPKISVSKKTAEKEKIVCIQAKFKELYEKDPIEFVRNAYFNCVETLRSKTQGVAEWVFGNDHEHVKSLFEKRDGHSLNSLRGALAHGVSGLVDEDIEHVVEKRTPELGAVVKSFLTRIIFGLKPGEALPQWSGQHSLAVQTDDPRNAHVVSHLNVIPNTDWRIRPEWIEEL